MAAGFKALDMLNQRTKASIADDTPRAKFRTKDLSIYRIYANTGNFYPQEDIEQKAGEILAVGMLENLVVKYEPLGAVGEYKLISGERRWRALRLLVERGYKDFELVTCNIVSPSTLQEEKIALIIANSHRNKSVATLLREEHELKETLEYMRANGIKLKGYDLESGRLRDVIAELLNTSPTKIAQIEAVNNNLISEFTKEIDNSRIPFSVAYELSGMSEEKQREALAILEETGKLEGKTVKSMKESLVSESDTRKDGLQDADSQDEDSAAGTQQGETASEEANPEKPQTAAGSKETYTEEPQMAAGSEETSQEEPQMVADSEEASQEEPQVAAGSEYQIPHPESITSLCYSCKNYSDCNVKTGTCRRCDQYINKAESEKTEEQRYSEEQDRIDRETARKLREMADRKRMEALPSDHTEGSQAIHRLKIGSSYFHAVKSGKKSFELRKNDRNYKTGDILELLEYMDGEHTGQILRAQVTYLLEDHTGLEDGYCIMAIKVIDDES